MKMKRFFLFFTTMLASVLLAFGIAACDGCGDDTCNHEETEVRVTATCTVDGFKETVCKDCGEVLKSEAQAALGHDKRETVENATCTTYGKVVNKCVREGCTFEEETENEALGHAWTNAAGVLAAVCEDRECSRCDATLPATVAHVYEVSEELSTAATCKEKGKEVYVCTVCQGGQYEEEIDKIGHNMANVTWTLGTPVKKNDVQECTYVRTDKANCPDCNNEVSREIETPHNYKWTITTTATCTTAGQKTLVCEGCSEPKADTNPISYSVGHTWEGTTCTACGKGQITHATVDAPVTKTELAGSEIKLKEAAITMPSGFVDTLEEGATMNLSAQKQTKDDLDVTLGEEDAAKLEGAPIYNLTLTVNDTPATSFGENNYVTVTVPYDLAQGEDPDSIIIAYINGDGEVSYIEGGEYANGFVTFQTNHFSYYSVSRLAGPELCEKKFGGHLYVHSVKAPTCTQFGYDVHICTRCGSYQEGGSPVILPTGHSWVFESEVEPSTCTTNGVSSYKCETCDARVSRVTPATGHYWETTQNTPATCQASGVISQKCTGCDVTYTETLAQFHSYTHEIVEATCTQEGYTRSTCRDCQKEKKGAVIPAKGHTWNIAEATCGQGQVCLVCNTNGNAATGQHDYDDKNICKVCGAGCAHEYAVQEQVNATCTKDGYKIEKCSKCESEVKTVLKSAGHKYEGNSIKCTVCNAVYVDMKSMFDNLITDGYSVVFEDVEVAVNIIEKTKDTQGTVLDENTESMKISYNAGEMYLSLKTDKDGKQVISLYMNGSMTLQDANDPTNSGTGFAEVYGDGEYIYVTVSYQANDVNLPAETNTIRISYQSYLDEMGDMYGDMMGGGISGGTTSKPDYNVGVEKLSVGETDYEDSSEMSIEQMLSQLLAIEEIEQLVNMFESRSDVAYDVMGSIFTAAFDGAKKADGTGYVYTLNTAKFVDFANDLYTCTFKELIDKYVGETAFEDISAYLIGLETKTVKEFVTEIFDFADANGFSSATIIAAIEALLNMETPEGTEKITISQYLDNPEMGGLTISELFDMVMSMGGTSNQGGGAMPMADTEEEPAMTYIDAINQALKMCEGAKLIDLVPVEEDDLAMIEQVLDTYEAVLSKISVVITTNNSMAIETIVSKIDQLDMDEFFKTSYEIHEEETDEVVSVREETIGIKANGSVTVTLGRVTIPDKASTVKTTFEGKYAKLVTAVKKALQNAEDNVIISSGLGSMDGTPGILRLNEGIVEYYNVREISALMEGIDTFFEETEPTIADISKAAMVDLYQGCVGTDSWAFVLSGSMNTYYSADVCVNLKTGEVVLDIDSPFGGMNLLGCDLKVFTPTTLPEGIKLSMDEVDCGEYWFTYYKCQNDGCDRVYRDYNRKWHDYEYVYSLAEGSSDCTQGVIEEDKCTYCGDVRDTEVYYEHKQNEVAPFVFALPHGEITVRKFACPCGKEVEYRDYDLFDDDNACLFDVNNDEYLDSWSGVTNAYPIVKYACIDSGELTGDGPCGYYLLKIVYNPVPTATQPCRSLKQTEYRMYDGNDRQVGTALVIDSYEESHSTITDPNDSSKTICEVAGCQYEKYYKETSDAYGRRLTYLSYTKAGDGSYLGYLKERYVYDANCNYTEYDVNGHPNNAEYVYTTGTSHVWETVDAKTERCKACQAYMAWTYDTYGRELSYTYYIQTAAGEYTEYYMRVYTYTGCDYTCAVYNRPDELSHSYTGTTHASERVKHVNPTCTQPGRWMTVCKACGVDSTVAGFGDWGYWYYDADHRWEWNDDKQCYVCQDCQLESAQEGSNIVLEDLTNHETYGEEGYYTIGFRENWWNWSWSWYGTPAYTINFTFVEIATGDFVMDTATGEPFEVVPTWNFDSGFDSVFCDEYYWNNWFLYENNLLRFSVADIDAAATNAGIDLSSGDYALRIQFIPMGASQYADMFYLTDFVSAQA